MNDEIDVDLRQALRAEAYRVPVRLGSAELLRRVEVDVQSRRRTFGMIGSIAAAAAVLVASVIAFTPARDPATNGQGASPSPSCQESPATKHGGWWYEMGGPRAFFNIQPGTRTSTGAGEAWLLIVRVDPAPRATEELSIVGAREGSMTGTAGALNSQMTPGGIGHFGEPAPALPGGWYLFEVAVPHEGCWTFEADIDGVVVGAATVSVGPGPAPSSEPVGPTPEIAGETMFNVTGSAPWCGSIGGCAYYLDLVGEQRHDRVKLNAAPALDTDPETPLQDRIYPIELGSFVAPLPPGIYQATLTSFSVSDAITGGEPFAEQQLASCSTGFIIDRADTFGVVVEATFSATGCTASSFFVVLTTDAQYSLNCGPVDLERCHELADAAVGAVLMRFPRQHVVALTFTGADGDYLLELDDGRMIELTIN